VCFDNLLEGIPPINDWFVLSGLGQFREKPQILGSHSSASILRRNWVTDGAVTHARAVARAACSRLESAAMSEKAPRPPRVYDEFSETFPKVRNAWDLLGDAAAEGPLDDRTARLVKLGIAIGAMREGAVHSSARKARALGIATDELNQVVALSASIIGMPSAVAVWTWLRDTEAK
jgi:alkylhydroperoxidase/carboxymuconolactone decarboxylase family protein YurZ